MNLHQLNIIWLDFIMEMNCRDMFLDKINQQSNVLKVCALHCHHLRGQGGLRENFSEIDFLIVLDIGDGYLSAAFGPMKKYCS